MRSLLLIGCALMTLAATGCNEPLAKLDLYQTRLK